LLDKSLPATDSVVVIGLGRFGSAVARTLRALGHDVLAIDNDATHVQQLADDLPHLVQADATDLETLKQLDLAVTRMRRSAWAKAWSKQINVVPGSLYLSNGLREPLRVGRVADDEAPRRAAGVASHCGSG
jgi:voltage-gated potassium channel Kch